MKVLFVILLLSISILGIEISAPKTASEVSSTFIIPIHASNLDGLLSFQFHLNYDSNYIEPSGYNFGCSTYNTLADNFSIVCNVLPDGIIRIYAWSPYPISGDGVIANLTFRSITKENGYSSLGLSDGSFGGMMGDGLDFTFSDGEIVLFTGNSKYKRKILH